MRYGYRMQPLLHKAAASTRRAAACAKESLPKCSASSGSTTLAQAESSASERRSGSEKRPKSEKSIRT